MRQQNPIDQRIDLVRIFTVFGAVRTQFAQHCVGRGFNQLLRSAGVNGGGRRRCGIRRLRNACGCRRSRDGCIRGGGAHSQKQRSERRAP